MKNMLFFMLIVMLISCSGNSQCPLTIAQIESKTGLSPGTISTVDTCEVIPYLVTGEPYTNYLRIVGTNNSGGSVEAHITGTGSGVNWVAVASNDGVTGESCSGVGCSRCKLLKAGQGCECKRKATSDGYCNHSISTGGG